MSKLSIHTDVDTVYLTGEFCNWNLDNAICVKRKKGNKSIVVDEMHVGEYKVLSDKKYAASEVYPTDGREMPNRYFGGEANEAICCFF